MIIKHFSISLIILTIFLSCQTKSNKTILSDPKIENKIEAKIVSVNHTGNTGNYYFQVGISSPDKGCDQYANWWEVISESGDLIYRRILGHSHVNEQPFVRSGGGINISPDQVVIVRAHMNIAGYTTQVFKGSINSGFETFETDKDFAKALENQEPLAHSCAF